MDRLTKAEREAGIIIHRNPTKSGVRSSKSTDVLLAELPYKLRSRVVRPAIRKASKIVRKEVRSKLNSTGERTYSSDGNVVYGQPIGPSKKTGTRKKLTNKLKAKRSENKEMSKAIITRSWTKDLGAVVGATTGPSWKHAAQGHILEYGANIFLWGKVLKKDGPGGSKGSRYRLPPRPFLRPAVLKTKAAQKKAIVSTMKQWAKKIRSEVKMYPDVDDS